MKEARPVKTRFLLLTALMLNSFAFQAQAFYHPDEGRWISRDPIEEDGGANLYCHVRNASVWKHDALGLSDNESVSVVIDSSNKAVVGRNPNPCVKACAEFYNRTNNRRTEQGITLCFRTNQRCGCSWQRPGLPAELVQCTVEHEAMHIAPPFKVNYCDYQNKCKYKPDGLYSATAMSDDEILKANPSLGGANPVGGLALQMPLSECPAYRATFSCMQKVKSTLQGGPFWEKYVEKWNKAVHFWELYRCGQLYPLELPRNREEK